jgi:hypothetical protein
MRKRLFAALTWLCVLLLTFSWPARTQTPPSGKAVLEAYVSAWNRRDFTAVDKLLAPTRFTKTSQGLPATWDPRKSSSTCA